MKKENLKNLYFGGSLLLSFVLWTALVKFVDVKAIGPRESEVGFAALNGFFHNLTGVNMTLYTVTDWLGLIPLAVVAGFGLLGLIQWVRRRHLKRVDYSIFVLGGFYIVTFAAFIFFEKVVINYRPVLIGGVLEASYPSSTTLLVTCVMPTALMQLNRRIKSKPFKITIAALICGFTVFMVAARLFSGVHWLTDIIGGALLSVGLVMLYRYFVGMKS